MVGREELHRVGCIAVGPTGVVVSDPCSSAGVCGVSQVGMSRGVGREAG